MKRSHEFFLKFILHDVNIITLPSSENVTEPSLFSVFKNLKIDMFPINPLSPILSVKIFSSSNIPYPLLAVKKIFSSDGL